MMREIKFRGKRKDNGDWVYGNLIKINIYGYIASHIFSKDNKNGDCTYYEVDESIVGQFTGMKDKNGTDIYEGDICKIFGVDEVWMKKLYIVDFIFGAFVFKNEKHGVAISANELKEQFLRNDKEPPIEVNQQGYTDTITCIESIGNVHENPEMS